MKKPDIARHVFCRSGIHLAFTALWLADPVHAEPLPAPTNIAQNVGTAVGVPAGSFENTAVTTYLQLTTWNGWNFAGTSGIVKEGQSFASSYPNLPSGEYALYLQGSNSSVSKTYARTAGIYRVSFDAGQRNQNQAQIVSVWINDQEYFRKKIDAGPLAKYYTRPFRHVGGNLKIEIKGLQSGANTAFVDDLKLEPMAPWNSTASWMGGVIPDAFADIVNIPSDVRMVIEENRDERAGDIHVQGYLGVLQDGASSLNCRSLLVDGPGAHLQVGMPANPYPDKFEIRLQTNDVARNLVGFGNKFVGSRLGGLLELHGKDVTSYGKLAATVSSGNTIDVLNISGWEIDDEIVITSTNGPTNSTGAKGWLNFETFTIQNIQLVSPTVTRLTLSGNIQNTHLGEDQTYTRTAAPAKTWTFETRAYVGLLSRNIKVKGVLGTETGFGGHIMIMGAHSATDPTQIAGIGKISNVELFQMGQKTLGDGGLLGRYPFHWHMVGDEGEGQFIKNCSIHRSFNRAITVHGTNRTEVSNNVAFDHLGHGLFLEDGAEEDNVITSNLVLYSRKPPIGEEVIPSDNSRDEPQNRSPSSFWISNPKNTMDNNIAAGTEGTGYWFALSDEPMGPSALDSRFENVTPRINDLTSFVGNRSNSSMMALDINDSVDPISFDINTNIPYKPTNLGQQISQFKVYGNKTAVYSGGGSISDELIFFENEYVDNAYHTFVATYHKFENSLFVRETSHGLLLDSKKAVKLYDGPGRFVNNHFVGYNVAGASLFESGGGAVNRSNWLFSGSTFNHAGYPRVALDNDTTGDAMESIVDTDGTLTGSVNQSIITKHPILRTPSDTTPGNYTNAYLSTNRFMSMVINMPGTNPLTPMTFTRKGGATSPSLVCAGADPTNHNAVLIVSNSLYEYDVSFPSLPVGGRVSFQTRDSLSGDFLILKFIGVGNNKPGRVFQGNQATSLANLRAASTTSYFRGATDLYVKIVSEATALHTVQSTVVMWD